MLRANKSVIPPNFRISLHSTSTSILSPITPEPRRSLLTSYFLYGIKPFQSAARGPVPTRLHGNFHHPSPLFASGREVLLPVTTFLCLVKVITAIIRGGRISCQAFSRPVFFYLSYKHIPSQNMSAPRSHLPAPILDPHPDPGNRYPPHSCDGSL